VAREIIFSKFLEKKYQSFLLKVKTGKEEEKKDAIT